jgi:tetratricopeptide (TPR) repeat protein
VSDLRAETATSTCSTGPDSAPRHLIEHRIEELLLRCESADCSARRIDLLQEIARLYEQELGDAEAAYLVLQQALREDYSYDPVAEQLERILPAVGGWDRLLSEQLSAAADLEQHAPASAADAWLRIATWYDYPLDLNTYAVQAVRSALAICPDHRGALRLLADLLRKGHRWRERADILERIAELEPNSDLKVLAYLSLADAVDASLDDEVRVIAAYREALAIDPHCEPALAALERIYRTRRDWLSLHYVLAARADATDAPRTRLALHLESARLLALRIGDDERARSIYRLIDDADAASQLLAEENAAETDPRRRVELTWQAGWIEAHLRSDLDAAERHFMQALVIDADHVPAVRELIEVYERRGDWHKSAIRQARLAELVATDIEKRELLLRAAQIYRDRLHLSTAAIALYEQAAALQPDGDVAIATELADLYERAGRWDELAPTLALLLSCARSQRATSREIADLCVRSALCAQHCGQSAAALVAYHDALRADPTHVRAMRGRADLWYESGQWHHAAGAYETLLTEHEAHLGRDEVSALATRLGKSYLAQNAHRRAHNAFCRALDANPHDRNALAQLSQVERSLGRWPEVLRANQRLLVNASREERLGLLDENATIYAEQLGDPQRAIASLRAAAVIEPLSRSQLQRLLGLYADSQQWREAVGVIDLLIDCEPDPLVRGRLCRAAAAIYRDHLRSPDRAIDYYERALDLFFADASAVTDGNRLEFLRAFAAIDALLTQHRDWDRQKRAYARMIRRMPAGDPVLIPLWDALGEICRSRLKRYDEAIAAYEVAERYQPDDVRRRAILAELYVLAGPDKADKVIAQHREMLRTEPRRAASYRALMQTFLSRGDRDAAWAACSALRLLGQDEPSERAYFERYATGELIAASHRMNDETWQLVAPHSDTAVLSGLLSRIWQLPARRARLSQRELGLSDAPEYPDHRAEVPVVRGLAYAAACCRVAVPPVYTLPHQEGGLVAVNVAQADSAQPAILARAQALGLRDDKEIAFVCAQTVTHLRPEFFLRTAVADDDQLRDAVAAAVRLARPDLPVEVVAPRAVQHMVVALQRTLDPRQLEQHRIVVDQFLHRVARVDVAHWRQTVDQIANRVGYHLCGELTTAAAVLQRECAATGSAIDDKVADLLRYSVSDECAQIRRHLGIVIAGTR